eukprot:3467533-Rhodomonas_salina.2
MAMAGALTSFSPLSLSRSLSLSLSLFLSTFPSSRRNTKADVGREQGDGGEGVEWRAAAKAFGYRRKSTAGRGVGGEAWVSISRGSKAEAGDGGEAGGREGGGHEEQGEGEGRGERGVSVAGECAKERGRRGSKQSRWGRRGRGDGGGEASAEEGGAGLRIGGVECRVLRGACAGWEADAKDPSADRRVDHRGGRRGNGGRREGREGRL